MTADIVQNAASASVHVPGARIREKMELALKVWAAKYPREAAEFAEDCDRQRRLQAHNEGYWISSQTGARDTDMAVVGIRPPRLSAWLEMTEMQSQMYLECGVPCGLGKKLWWKDREMLELFFDVCQTARTSKLRGVPRHGAPPCRSA